MSESEDYTGGCLCGAVRYRAQGRPERAGYCYCSLCRRAAGAPVVPWVVFPLAAFTITQGEPKRYASSPPAVRQFCGDCGTQLTFHHADRPEWIDVTVASLDDPARTAPSYHIFDADRVPWLRLADDLPRFPAYRDN